MSSITNSKAQSTVPDFALPAASTPTKIELKTLAPLPRGEVLLYINDANDRDVSGGLWRWRPDIKQPAVRIADTQAIADASGMGSLIALADAQAVRSGDGVWLVLRSPDQAAVLRLDGGPFATGQLRMSRPFKELTADEPGFRLAPADRWFARAGGGLGLMRPGTGEIWNLDSAGRLTAVPQSADRPASTVPPLDWSPGPGQPSQVVRFIPAPPVKFAVPDESNAPRYPALVIGEGATEKVLNRDAFAMPAGFPTYGLRITAWCATPGGDIIAYDAMSGQVLRMTITSP